MKKALLTIAALSLIVVPALTQSQRLNRTNSRKHTRVDSVSTWAHGPKDSTRAHTDTTGRH